MFCFSACEITVHLQTEIFSDKHGMLALAAKQKQKLAKWVRPEDFLEAPCIIDKIDSGTIKQV